jgi:hypothetical protein
MQDLTQYCSLSLNPDTNASTYTNAFSAQSHEALGRTTALSLLASRSSHRVNFVSSPYEANVCCLFALI